MSKHQQLQQSSHSNLSHFCHTVARWQIKEDGHKDPNLRVLAKPLLNLFHGDRGCKRWKNAMDAELKHQRHGTMRSILDATLHHIPAEVLDAPPARAPQELLHESGTAGTAGFNGLSIGALPRVGDRAGGLESLKRLRKQDTSYDTAQVTEQAAHANILDELPLGTGGVECCVLQGQTVLVFDDADCEHIQTDERTPVAAVVAV